ncbi:MAG: hypothetical protein AAFR30_10630, partial [Cyanobacteria bacterium J06628_4]
MIIFRSTPKPIWRQTWLRLLLLSGSAAGLAMLMIPRLPSEWVAAARELADPSTVSAVGANDDLAQLQPVDTTGVVRPYVALTQLSNSLTQRVLQKEQAAGSYNRAIKLAQQALALRKQGSTPELSQQEKQLWQDAVNILASIDTDSDQYSQAQAKLKEYRTIATLVDRRISQERSDFLVPIAAASGNPNTV